MMLLHFFGLVVVSAASTESSQTPPYPHPAFPARSAALAMHSNLLTPLFLKCRLAGVYKFLDSEAVAAYSSIFTKLALVSDFR